MNLKTLQAILSSRRVIVVVLPTSDIVTSLVDSFKDKEVFDPSIDKIVDQILMKIASDCDVLRSLSELKDEYEKIIRSIAPEHCDEVGRVIYRAGIDLHHLLETINAYENRYLIYMKKGWSGMNLILERIDPEEIPEII